MFQEDRLQIQQEGRAAGSALRVHQLLQERPVTSIQHAVEQTGPSFPAASSAMQMLERRGIVRELTGKRRNRLYGYTGYLDVLNEGTELP